jgi:ADP-heptose:LPS heptosyltransferase
VKILINRSDAIGDTLLTMPIAKRIKQDYPEAKIAFIISKKCEDLFINHPYIDQYFIFDHKRSYLKKYKLTKNIFKEFKPDYYLHIGGSHIPSYYAWKSRVEFRGGLINKWQTFAFLNKGVRQKRSLVAMHEADYNLNLLSPMGIEYNAFQRRDLEPVVNITETEAKDAKTGFAQELQKAGLKSEREYIFIHPGMTGHTLNWASRNYARLIVRLFKTYPDKYNYIISHTPSDEKWLQGLRSHLSQDEFKDIIKSIYYFNGMEKGLRNYMAVLKSAKVFIGPSTGTTHIANALKVPLVGLYSPIKVQSSLRWGPFNREKNSTIVMVPDVVCGEQFNCAGKSCPYYECMAKIEVEDVIHALAVHLEN